MPSLMAFFQAFPNEWSFFTLIHLHIGCQLCVTGTEILPGNQTHLGPEFTEALCPIRVVRTIAKEKEHSQLVSWLPQSDFLILQKDEVKFRSAWVIVLLSSPSDICTNRNKYLSPRFDLISVHKLCPKFSPYIPHLIHSPIHPGYQC